MPRRSAPQAPVSDTPSTYRSTDRYLAAHPGGGSCGHVTGVGGSDFGEEGGDGCRAAGVGLEVGQVGGAGQDLEAGGGGAFGQHGGAGFGVRDVEGTQQNEG